MTLTRARARASSDRGSGLDPADLAGLHHPAHFFGGESTLGSLCLGFRGGRPATGPGAIGPPHLGRALRDGGHRRERSASPPARKRLSSRTIRGPLALIAVRASKVVLPGRPVVIRAGAGRREIVALLQRGRSGRVGTEVRAGGLCGALSRQRRPGLGRGRGVLGPATRRPAMRRMPRERTAATSQPRRSGQPSRPRSRRGRRGRRWSGRRRGRARRRRGLAGPRAGSRSAQAGAGCFRDGRGGDRGRRQRGRGLIQGRFGDLRGWRRGRFGRGGRRQGPFRHGGCRADGGRLRGSGARTRRRLSDRGG